MHQESLYRAVIDLSDQPLAAFENSKSSVLIYTCWIIVTQTETLVASLSEKPPPFQPFRSMLFPLPSSPLPGPTPPMIID